MTIDENELDRLQAKGRCGELLDALEISGPIAQAMLADPFASVPILEAAKRNRQIRNPAAFAISRWRQLLARPLKREPEPEPELPDPEPPSLSLLECHWARGGGASMDAIARAIGSTWAHKGGLAAMLARDFQSWTAYGPEGEIVSVSSSPPAVPLSPP